MKINQYLLAIKFYNHGDLPMAKSLLKKILSHDGDHVPSLHLLSRIYFLEHDRAAALAALDKALVITPDAAPLLFGRGVVLAALAEHEKALSAFERVLQLDSGHDQALNNKGNALLALGRPWEALEAYAGAIRTNPANADAQYNTGVILEQTGNTVLAEKCLRAAVGLAPANARFRFGLAECASLQPDDNNLVAMERLLAESPSADECVLLHFGLGKAYDDRGETAAAFRHYAEGNALKRRSIAYDEAAALQLLRPPLDATMTETGQSAAKTGAPVPIFVLGMPRSGSTLVEQILSRHPRVTPAGETGLFPQLANELLTQQGGGGDADAMLTLPAAPLLRLGADYLAALEHRHPGAEFVTDKTPVNFRYLPLIRAALPGAVIVHTQRDARDTCLSCYFRLFVGESQPFTYDLGELARYYNACQVLMAHWRKILPPGSFLDVSYERVIDDLPGEARRLLLHCSLAWSEQCLAPHEGVRFVQSDPQVLKPLYASSVGRWRRYAPFLDAFVFLPRTHSTHLTGQVESLA